MAKNYLPCKDLTYQKKKLIGPDPANFYVGRPWKSNGWFCYAPPIVSAANKYFTENDMPYVAEDFSGAKEQALRDKINSEDLLLIWVTRDLQNARFIQKWHFETSGKQSPVPVNLHCVVLKGFSGNKLHYMDPIAGNKTADSKIFFNRYRQLGSHAVLIRKKEEVSAQEVSVQELTISSDPSAFRIKKNDAYVALEENSTPNFSQMLVSLKYFAEITQSEIIPAPSDATTFSLTKESKPFLTFTINSKEAVMNEQRYPLRHPVMQIDDEIYISLLDLATQYNILLSP